MYISAVENTRAADMSVQGLSWTMVVFLNGETRYANERQHSPLAAADGLPRFNICIED